MSDAFVYERGKTPRYRFRPSEKYQGMADVLDIQHMQSVCLWPMSMAQVLSAMYGHAGDTIGWLAADEFMYGATLGHTYTLIDIDKMPIIEQRRSEDGKSLDITFTMPDGQIATQTHNMQEVLEGKTASEQLARCGMTTRPSDSGAPTLVPADKPAEPDSETQH